MFTKKSAGILIKIRVFGYRLTGQFCQSPYTFIGEDNTVETNNDNYPSIHLSLEAELTEHEGLHLASG